MKTDPQATVEFAGRCLIWFLVAIITIYLLFRAGWIFASLALVIRRSKGAQDLVAAGALLGALLILFGNDALYLTYKLLLSGTVPTLGIVIVNFGGHLLILLSFSFRCISLLSAPASETSKVWRANVPRREVWISAGCGCFLSGVYLVRHMGYSLFEKSELPWPNFWIHTALIAVVTWASVTLAVALAVAKENRVRGETARRGL